MGILKKLGLTASALLLVPALALAQQAATPSTAPAAGAIEEITVTGIRASVKAAQEIKREAPSVVEAITTEDLGKFTDKSIADALQRVPGVNITRSAGTFDTGYQVTIRGLGAGFSNSTLNGRDVLGVADFFGGGGRTFDFQTIPTEVLSGVVVYKTSTANLIEPGLAGQVDMQTLKPLDYADKEHKDVFLSGNVALGRDGQSKRVGESSIKDSPRFSAVLGGRFLDNTLAFYVAGLYANDYTRNDLAEHYDSRQTFTTTDGVVHKNTRVLIYGYDFWRANQERTKRSVASAVQWKPNANFELNADILYNKSAIIRRDQTNYWYPAIGQGGFGVDPVPNAAVRFSPSGQGVVAWDANQMTHLGGYAQNNIGFLKIDYKNEALYGGLNGRWTSDDGRFSLSADYARANIDYTISWLHPYLINTNSRDLETVDASGEKPVINITNTGGVSASDPLAYDAVPFSENYQRRNRGQRDSARLDLELKFADDLVLKAGVRQSRTNFRYVAMDQNVAATVATGAATSQLVQLPFTNFLTPTVNFDTFCAANPVWCYANNFGKGSLVGDIPTSVNGKPGDVLHLDFGDTYKVVETNSALYTQLDFKHDLFGIKSSGNVGLRAVRIKEDTTAFQDFCQRITYASQGCTPGTEVVQLVYDNNSYWKYLPSFNLSLQPRDSVTLRLSVAKTMSLGNFSQLAPSGKASLVTPNSVGLIADKNTASSGNTHLKPTSATNYDFTTEYYTSYGGAIIASVFYKDVKDLILRKVVTDGTVAGQGNVLFDVTTYINAPTGHSYGAELGTNQPFTFLPAPWDGFGLEANYTYVDSKTTFNGRITRFPGSAKNNINLSTYFEKYGWAARVAYSYHSDVLAGNSTAGDSITRASKILDASLSKEIGHHFEIILTGSNLTSDSRSDYNQTAGFVVSYYQFPRLYSLGVRGTL